MMMMILQRVDVSGCGDDETFVVSVFDSGGDFNIVSPPPLLLPPPIGGRGGGAGASHLVWKSGNIDGKFMVWY